MNTLISAENLVVGYDGKTIVDGISFAATGGELICLLGSNGAGKSTILKTLTGLIEPISGRVLVDGVEIKKIKKSELAKKMAIVLTEHMSINFLTVFEIVSMGRYPYTNFLGQLSNHDKKLILEALDSVDALKLQDRFYSSLSDGEKQKIMIARALVQKPQIIVLDEPTSHLDVKHKIEVISILKNLCTSKDITVILTIHDIDLAIKGCDIVLLIKNGKVESAGQPEKILKKGSIQKLYDIAGAKYNELLGSFEFLSPTIADFFVTGGNATGAPVYRALSRARYGMCCGILHDNDIDAHIAKTLNCTVVSEKAFNPISDINFGMALKAMDSVDYVIDTGFPVGELNHKNEELLANAIDMGKKVLSLSNEKRACLEGKDAVTYFIDMGQLLDYIKHHKHEM